MQKNIIFLLVITMLCSPLITAAYAGQVQAQQFSHTETDTIAAMQANSAPLMQSIQGGGDDALVIAFAAVGILVLICAAAASSSS